MKKIFLIPLMLFISVNAYSFPKEKKNNPALQAKRIAYIFNDKGYECKKITTKDLKSAVQIYFLGGCGYLISGGGKNILIDALYKHPHPKFLNIRTPKAAFKKMLNKEPPFRKIDLILVSHYHPDHFTTDRGFPVLMKHPEARLIANHHTLSLAREDDLENFEKVKNRIISQNLDWGEIREIHVNGCSIKLYLVKHTGNAHLDREYIVTQFLIEVQGLKILHMGDMYAPANMEYFKKFGLAKMNIDIVFYVHGISEAGKALLTKFVKPKFIVAMHNRLHDEGPYYKSMMKEFPNITIFLKPLERKIFIKSKKKAIKHN